MNKFEIVLATIKKAWEALEPTILEGVLDEDTVYYETPNEKPLIGANKIIAQWQKDLSTQSKVDVSYQIQKHKENVAIAWWRASWVADSEEKKSEGVFYIELNNKGILREFRQWWI